MAKSGHVVLEIEGWDEVENNLRKIAEHIDAQATIEDALSDGAEVVRDAIAANAPRNTGRLAGSIAISKQGREKYSVRIGPTISGFYGRFIEYGTSRMGAQPFMRPAFDSVRPQVQTAIGEAIWKAIQEASP